MSDKPGTRGPTSCRTMSDTAGLEVTEGYKPDVDTGLFSYATHAARVAVDAETGLVEILDYVIVEDCGRMVNPMIVEGQALRRGRARCRHRAVRGMPVRRERANRWRRR